MLQDVTSEQTIKVHLMEEYLGRLALLMDFSSSQILAVMNSTAIVMTLGILIHLIATHGV